MSDSSNPRSTLQVVAAVLLFAIAGLILWRGVLSRYLGPAPVVPDNLTQVDPLVAEAVESSARAVQQNKGDLTLREFHCLTLQANGMPESALSCWEQVLAIDSERARAWYLSAQIHEREGRLPEAVEALDRAFALEPFVPFLSWRRGLWLVELGRSEEALAAIQRAIDLDPDQEAAWFALARVQLSRGEHEAAVATLTEHSLAEGGNAGHARHLLASAYRAQGRGEEAAALVAGIENRAPTFQDPWTAEMLRRRTGYSYLASVAARLVQTQRYPEALQVLESLRGQDSDDHRIAALEAQCHLQLGRPDRSVEILEEAVEQIPDNALLYTNLTLATLALPADTEGRLQRALAYGERAVALAPDSGKAHLALARTLWIAGRFEPATTEYQRSFELDARDPVPFIQAAHWMIDEGRLVEAGELLEKLASSATDRASWWAGRVRIELALGGSIEAREAMERALSAPLQDAGNLEVLRDQVDSIPS